MEFAVEKIEFMGLRPTSAAARSRLRPSKIRDARPHLACCLKPPIQTSVARPCLHLFHLSIDPILPSPAIKVIPMSP